MNPFLIFGLILGPWTAFLVWLIVCEIRGVPAFADAPPPEPGTLDTLGAWIFAGAWAFIAFSGFVAAGWIGALLTVALITALAVLIAVVWTLAQTLKRSVARRKAARDVDVPPAISVRQRFLLNLRRTIIEIPGRILYVAP